MKSSPLIAQIRSWTNKNRKSSIVIMIVILIGVYYGYRGIFGSANIPQYTLSPARIGAITQVVTGSGQVSSENQLDVASEVSGKIKSINVNVGQHVNKGDLLVTLDAHDAAISLESAQISYAKLVQPAKASDLANAENTVAKAYVDGYNAATSLYLDLPTIMSGLKSIFYDANGFLSDQKTSYLISEARTRRDNAGVAYDKAVIAYSRSLKIYTSTNRSSTHSETDAMIDDAYNLAKLVSAALQQTQDVITYISTYQPDYYDDTNRTTTASNVTSWSSQINSDVSTIASSRNSIVSNQNSLSTLIEGADSLDIQSQRLSLQQAEENYAKYFIRAPFDGIIGRIPVSVYGSAGASTVVATLIGDRKIANISLNEVDAAKVNAGQPVSITFDAIDGLAATGTVERVDLVGTVSQGVVSYTVRIIINTTDDRIKPGMSMNVSIVTKEKSGVLIVPSSAIKTQNGKKYVEILPASALPASTTGAWAGRDTASSTNSSPSGPRSQNGAIGAVGRTQTRSVTVTTTTAPIQVTVTTGDTDDTNTEILTGLERGQWVITRTTNTGATTSATPNILTSLGGNRNPGTAAIRARNN